ncbi:MAG: hypothetical protein VX347_02565 [Bacteroidota bacterium]|nr:hypothetical protein [Bacteroidota bacterium]
MKIVTANLINSISLITLGLWGYLDSQSPTALIPVFFGVILFLCNKGLKKENKIIAHIVVLLTFLILVALAGMRLPKSLDIGGIGLYRVITMIATSAIAMLSFIASFIQARSKK